MSGVLCEQMEKINFRERLKTDKVLSRLNARLSAPLLTNFLFTILRIFGESNCFKATKLQG